MPKFKPYFDVTISEDYTPKERQAIASEIIDRVITRTEKGIDKDNVAFKKYVREYAKFKGQNNVDLTYSAKMLADLEVISTSKGKIRIGYRNDYEDLGKVEGNVLGTYGDDNRKIKKPRNFLGITEKDVKSILKHYPLDNKDLREKSVREAKEADQKAREILNDSEVDNGQG